MTAQDAGQTMSAEFRKTLSETDLILFAGLSGDLHPVHIDEQSPAAREAGGRTIHAVFLIALMSTAVSRLMQARGLHSRVAGFSTLTFYRPARPGDTVRAGARIGPARPAGGLQVEITATTDAARPAIAGALPAVAPWVEEMYTSEPVRLALAEFEERRAARRRASGSGTPGTADSRPAGQDDRSEGAQERR